MEEFAKYLVALARLTPDDGEAIAAVQKKLNELVDADIKLFLEILDKKSQQWGEVARSVNKTTAEIKNELMEKVKRS